MKVKQLILTSAVLVAISFLSAGTALALTSAEAKAIKTAVTSVPVPEMPAKAAELVTKAEKADREAVAVVAVRSIVMRNKAAAPVVVAAIIKAAPEVAVAVTANAVELAGEQEAVIVRAAMVSAPDQAREISAYAKKSSAEMAQNSASSAVLAQNSGITKAARVRGAGAELPVRNLGAVNTPQGVTTIEAVPIGGGTFTGTPTQAPAPTEYKKVNVDVPPSN